VRDGSDTLTCSSFCDNTRFHSVGQALIMSCEVGWVALGNNNVVGLVLGIDTFRLNDRRPCDVSRSFIAPFGCHRVHVGRGLGGCVPWLVNGVILPEEVSGSFGHTG
jgi:hypothetical protein